MYSEGSKFLLSGFLQAVNGRGKPVPSMATSALCAAAEFLQGAKAPMRFTGVSLLRMSPVGQGK